MVLTYRRVRAIVFSVIVACLISVGIVVSYPAFSSQGQNMWGPRIRDLAPDFVLRDLDGERVRLADHREKVILLLFSTTWCPHCRQMPPYLNELHREYSDRELEIFNINIQEPSGKVRSYAAKEGITYKVLLDKTGETAMAYEVRGVPSIILVDRDGTIVCRQCRSVEKVLETLLPRAE